MKRTILPRRFWYSDDSQLHHVGDEFLTSATRSLVVLGEAGMGKSTALERLAEHDGYVRCTARALINAADVRGRFGHARTLVIDALDEVAAQRDGEAVDLVVRRLGELGYPRFILACRIADWREATALEGLKDFYTPEPLQLHLAPLERDDAAAFLKQAVGGARAEGIIEHLEGHGLSGLSAIERSANGLIGLPRGGSRCGPRAGRPKAYSTATPAVAVQAPHLDLTILSASERISSPCYSVRRLDGTCSIAVCGVATSAAVWAGSPTGVV